MPQQLDADRDAPRRIAHDERDDRLAGARVRHADHRDVGDVGVLARAPPRPRPGYTLKPDTMMRSLARSTR